jgi:hypothetical protein
MIFCTQCPEETVQHANIGKRNGKQEKAEGKAMRLDSVPTATLSLTPTKGNVVQKVRVPQHALKNKTVHSKNTLWTILFLLIVQE